MGQGVNPIKNTEALFRGIKEGLKSAVDSFEDAYLEANKMAMLGQPVDLVQLMSRMEAAYCQAMMHMQRLSMCYNTTVTIAILFQMIAAGQVPQV